MKYRIKEIDFLRGLAAILMIISHTIVTHPVDLMAIKWCSVISEVIGSFDMHLFFLVGGVCYKYNEKKNYSVYLRKKARRLLIPYVLFCIIYWMVHSLFSNQQTMNSLIDLFKGIVLGGKYWFLYVLFFIYAIYPIFERIIICLNYQYKVEIKAIAIISLLIMYRAFDITGVFYIDKIVFFLPYFIIGDIINHFSKRYVYRNLSVMNKLLIIIFLGSIYFILFGIESHIIRIIKPIIAFTIIFTLTSILYTSTNGIVVHICEIVEECSKYSLQIYLFNDYFITVLMIIFVNILNITAPIALIFFVSFITIAISIGLSKFIFSKSTICRCMLGI